MFLGIDTGGTYTDAALVTLDPEGGPPAVRASAKALTTHRDLAAGVAAAVDRALASAEAPAEDVRLVGLSTTLATNALVEGAGAPAALVLIGFGPDGLARAGLREALAGAPALEVSGGHDAHGAEAAPFDAEALRAALATAAPGVSAVAVAAQFGTRNPAHEQAARALIRAETGLPTTCSHELTARLGGPRRALTALLNARLIGLIDRLIVAVSGLLADRGIAAPLMVVKGDGALMSAETARERPIETILSGPAASLRGAAALTGASTGAALVSDIGGTTTDIARLDDGAPRLDPEGATVGGWRTFVEAASIRTVGLGGDSIVDLDPTTDALILGPRRSTPVSLLATQAPGLVQDTLARQTRAPRTPPEAGRFLTVGAAVGGESAADRAERALLDQLLEGPLAWDMVVADRARGRAAERLRARGAARLAAFTPSDAAHALGRYDAWDIGAAAAAAALFARRKDRLGRLAAESGAALSERVLALLARRSAEEILAVAGAADGLPEEAFTGPLAAAVLDRRAAPEATAAPAVALAMDLTAPLIALGASAAAHYPAVGRLLNSAPVIPRHADVANAVGAVAGPVTARREAVILEVASGRFEAAVEGPPVAYPDLETATEAVTAALRAAASAAALRSGAVDPAVVVSAEDRRAVVEGREMIVERRLRADAAGRPRHAESG